MTMAAKTKTASKQLAEQAARILKKRRIGLKLKQSDAAERAGISLGALRKFEQTGLVSLERFFKLCRLYRMDAQIMAAMEQRDSWALEEIKRAETRKTVRDGRTTA